MGENMIELVQQYELALKNMLDTLAKEQLLSQKLDSKINDFQHIIEYKDLSASEMSKVYKHLKDLYRLRRQHKENIILLKNIIEHRKNSKDEFKESDTRLARYKRESENSYKKFLSEESQLSNP
jgi:DNA repair ATPase RecN